MIHWTARKRRILLTAFHWGVPGVPNNTPIQLKVYPNYHPRPDSLDLDLAALLASTGAVYDKSAFEYVRDQPFLRRMTETMQELEGEGRLELVSYADQIAGFAGTLEIWLDQMLAERPEKWRRHIIAQLRQQRDLTAEQAPIIGRTLNAAYEGLASGVMAHLTLIGDRIDLVEGERIMKLLEKRDDDFTPDELAVLREVARPYLAQAGSDILLSNSIGVTLTPWFDLRAFYAAMAKSRHNPLSDAGFDRRVNEEGIRLFRDVVPHWRPETVKELIKFQESRDASESYVEALRESVTGKRPLTRELIEQEKEAVIYRHERAEHLEGWIKVVGVGTKLAVNASTKGAFPGVEEVVSETVLEALEYGVEAATLGSEEAVSRHGRKRHAWMSLLINMNVRRAKMKRASARVSLGTRVRSLLRRKRAA